MHPPASEAPSSSTPFDPYRFSPGFPVLGLSKSEAALRGAISGRWARAPAPGRELDRPVAAATTTATSFSLPGRAHDPRVCRAGASDIRGPARRPRVHHLAPDGPALEMAAGDAIMGDTVNWQELMRCA